jgi:hypothetical protein
MPFGRFGAGLLTGHPIGLVVVLGLLLIGLLGMPEYRIFFVASLALGGLFGLFLWLHHVDSDFTPRLERRFTNGH